MEREGGIINEKERKNECVDKGKKERTFGKKERKKD